MRQHLNRLGFNLARRQIYGEHSAAALLRVDSYRSLMPLDDAVTNRQTKTGAMRTLRRKEGLEDLLLNVFRHARSRVCKLQMKSVALTHAADRDLASCRAWHQPH